MRVADYLMMRLADLGARDIFFLPGGGAMYLNDALACEKRLVPIPCHHEQACGIAAEAWGRSRETFGVCMVTTGPGATNAITPVAGAWIDSIPMLVISGQVKRADLLNGRPLRQSGVQEVDIISMVQSITKYAVTITDPSQIRFHLDAALHAMLSGRAGPVWLDIPLDVQAAQVNVNDLPHPPPNLPLEGGGALHYSNLPIQGDDHEYALLPPLQGEGWGGDGVIEPVAKLLAQSQRPLILAGHGLRLSGAATQFVQLVNQLQIPVVTTWNALDLLPWDHPLNIGRPGVVALRAPNFAVQNCDLLISIGSRLDNVVTAYNPRGFARAAKKIIVDVDAEEINKLDMEIDLSITADARHFIDAMLSNSPSPLNCQPWRERCADWKSRYSSSATLHSATLHSAPPPQELPHSLRPLAGEGLGERETISHYHFVSALSDALPPNTPLATGSSGLAIEVFYSTFRNKPGQRVFLTSGLGAMGYGLPAAIGICLANDRHPTIAIESDGSLQLNLQELATLTALQLPITLIIMNNGGYASIRNTQRNYFEGRYLGTGPEAGLFLPDLDKLAATYGLSFQRINCAASLESDLTMALKHSGPMLIDVSLMPDETLSPKCAALPQADGSMLSMPMEDMSPLLSLEALEREMLTPILDASRCARQQP
ncbi:MAG: thiamine pyrophosphate-binding protein [Rhodocyclaceae bacterium]|nr:thiamine pyrophosphate-binding protein [Rhodocyclaceae bacterium]